MPKEKFKIYQYYNLLNKAQQEICRLEYKKRIRLSKGQFYNDLKSENLSDDKLLFFSRIFGVTMEHLYNDPIPGPQAVINFSLIFKEEKEVAA